MRPYIFRWVLVCTLGMALAPPMVRAQVAQGDILDLGSLPRLLEAVRDGNPMLQAARINATAMALRSQQVSALPDPTVMLTWQPFPILTARGTQRTQLRVEQTIPYPGKLDLRGSLASLTAQLVDLDASVQAEDMALAAKQAYYDLYRIGRQDSLIRAFQARIQEYESVATTQYTVGSGTQQAILKAQLERNSLDSRLLGLDRSRNSLMEMLSRLTDRRVVDGAVRLPAEATRSLRQPPEHLPTDTLLVQALSVRPEAAAIRTSRERADLDLALARREFYPDLGLNLTYFDIGAAAMPPTANGRDALAVGVAVRIPLQRGRLRARVEEARLERDRTTYRQQSLETAIDTEIRDLTQQMANDRAQLDLYENALLPQATITLEATLSAYTTGRTDFLNLLDAERMLFNLHWGYQEAFARFLKTTAALERALGVAWLADLHP